MMRFLPIFLCLSALWADLVAAEGEHAVGDHTAGAPQKLSPEAQKLVDGYQSTIAKLVAKTQQDIAKEKERVLAALEKEKEAQTKGGNLEAALAIKARIEAVASGRELAALVDPGNDLLSGQVAPDDALAAERNAIAKDQAEKLVAGLDALAEADWEKLGGIAFSVDAHAVIGAIDTGIVLKEGDSLLLVPNPNDKWKCGSGPNDGAPMTYKGDVAKDPHGTIRWGCLFAQVGERVQPAGFVAGHGKLWLKCNDGTTVDNQGVIRVKILRVVP